MIKTSIIIPTYNHLDDLLKPCIESIEKYTDLSDIEIIVVANGCTDKTREYLGSISRITHHPSGSISANCEILPLNVKTVWFDEPSGFTKSVNEGIKHACGEYIVILNNDAVLLDQPKNQWLQILSEPFKDEKVGITGPMVVNCSETRRRFVLFFCAMIRKKLFDELGLLDEVFSPGYGEDTDFCIRAQDAGYGVVQVPRVSKEFYAHNYMSGQFPIWHKGDETFKSWVESSNHLTRNRKILKERYPLKLNLGSGASNFPGFTNIDLYHDNADIKADVSKLPFADGEAVEIIAFHIVEHVSPYEVTNTLREWNRVLKPGGRLIIEMPDILELCRHFEGADMPKRWEILNCIYGTLLVEHPHLFGWYYDILRNELVNAGFKNIVKLPTKEDISKVPCWGYNFRVECNKEAVLPDGFFSEQDINSYRRFLKDNVPVGGVIAELGCLKGRSLASVADIIKGKNLQVIAVDTFVGCADKGVGKFDEDIKSVFLQNMENVGLRPRVLSMTTHEASKQFEDNYFDFVFIDADHAHEAVRQDIQDWLPKVKKGGILAGHDLVWKGVYTALMAEFGEIVSNNGNNIWFVSKSEIKVVHKPKIYDCFLFHNELDQLEIRLNELDSVVDYFVLVEGTETFSGKSKPLYFKKHEERFKKFLPKIKYIVVDKWPVYTGNGSAWVRESTQRDAIMGGLSDAGENDIVIISDVDEVVSAEVVKKYKTNMGMCALEMPIYYYYLNFLADNKWSEGRILPVSMFKEQNFTPCIARATSLEKLSKIPNAGWHFSFQGGVSYIIDKIQSYSHQEYNKAEILDHGRIIKLISEGKDVLGREHIPFKVVPLDGSYPEYVLENQEKFKHMIKELA